VRLLARLAQPMQHEKEDNMPYKNGKRNFVENLL
jgi:hypothetical protein